MDIVILPRMINSGPMSLLHNSCKSDTCDLPYTSSQPVELVHQVDILSSRPLTSMLQLTTIKKLSKIKTHNRFPHMG